MVFILFTSAPSASAASSGSQSRPQSTLITFQPAPRKIRLQLLDDLAVAADRAVELLQVAVDHPGEVVQLLAGGDADRAERLRLAHLTVAQERPDALVGGVLDAAVVQVAVEPRLVDRVDAVRPIETVGNSQKSGISRGCG